jgi:nitroreductase
MPTSVELGDVMRRQRAHRSFTPDDVPDDVVERLITLATFAPSAENRQPWEFVVVRDAARRQRIGELTERLWRHGAADIARSHLPPALLADVEAGATGGVAGAPVLIVVAVDTRRCHRDTIGPSIWPAVQNLLLAATAEGLGSALTTLPVVAGEQLAEIVGLPPEVEPVAVIPLGHPAARRGPPHREPAGAHLHRDRYGQRWASSGPKPRGAKPRDAKPRNEVRDAQR